MRLDALDHRAESLLGLVERLERGHAAAAGAIERAPDRGDEERRRREAEEQPPVVALCALADPEEQVGVPRGADGAGEERRARAAGERGDGDRGELDERARPSERLRRHARDGERREGEPDGEGPSGRSFEGRRQASSARPGRPVQKAGASGGRLERRRRRVSASTPGSTGCTR